MTLAHQTQKVTGAAAALSGDIISSDPKSVVSSKKEKEDVGNLASNQKHEKYIAAQIVQPLKLTSSKEDKKY